MKSQNNKNEFYETTDMWLAVFLKAKNVKLVDIRPYGNTKRVMFVFEKTKNIENLIREFYNNGEVPIKEIRSAYDDIKSAIRNL